MKTKIYLASHFFNRGGFLETEYLADYLTEFFGDSIELYVPHRNADINDKKGNDQNITDIDVYEGDMEKLKEVDVLIANLDGVEIDSGVAGEIMAAAMYNELNYDDKLIIGYTTDVRRNRADMDFLLDISDESNPFALRQLEQHKENFLYRNIMITGACRKWGALIDGYAYNDDYLLEIVKAVNEVVQLYDEGDL